MQYTTGINFGKEGARSKDWGSSSMNILGLFDAVILWLKDEMIDYVSELPIDCMKRTVYFQLGFPQCTAQKTAGSNEILGSNTSHSSRNRNQTSVYFQISTLTPQ